MSDSQVSNSLYRTLHRENVNKREGGCSASNDAGLFRKPGFVGPGVPVMANGVFRRSRAIGPGTSAEQAGLKPWSADEGYDGKAGYFLACVRDWGDVGFAGILNQQTY
jgi:hypothetical protein